MARTNNSRFETTTVFKKYKVGASLGISKWKDNIFPWGSKEGTPDRKSGFMMSPTGWSCI